MKKLMMLAAMLALVLAMAVPALAQVSQELGNEDETGNVELSFSAQSTGNNSNQCLNRLKFCNTGSNQNAQGFLQYASEADDLSGGGSAMTFAPVEVAPCDQKVQQSSAASST